LQVDARAQSSQRDIPFGESRLGISDTIRDGTVYVPKSYKAGVPMPLLMMLHGYAGSGEGMRYTFPLAEEFGVIVIAPESRDLTWGQSAPGFDPDVRYLERCRSSSGRNARHRSHPRRAANFYSPVRAVDGITHGDSFNHVMVLSAGLMIPRCRRNSQRRPRTAATRFRCRSIVRAAVLRPN
jgi:phospholipase/carboxylesterase